jgi:hypothetical protein
MDHLGTEAHSYPLPSHAALEPPTKWKRLRRKCPAAHLTSPGGPADQIRRRQLAGLAEVPVRW